MTYEQFWETVSVAQAALWVGGIGLAIAFIIKMWPFIRKFFDIVDALIALPEYMETTRSDISDIRHEVQYNNGSSVKDAVQRIENKMSTLEVGHQGLRDQLDQQDEKYDSLLD